MTKYLYKVSTFTVVDSESKSIYVLVNMGLSEDHRECCCVLSEWHDEFHCFLTSVIFTDGDKATADEAMAVAFSSLPYEEQIFHLCVHFICLTKMSKIRVQPLLRSDGNFESWTKFRTALKFCREAGSPEELERLWDILLRGWFGDDAMSRKVMKYLNEFVWSKRYSRETCFFLNEFTMGHSTTQRSEGWH